MTTTEVHSKIPAPAPFFARVPLGRLDRFQPQQAALLLFFMLFVVYAGLTPYVTRHWWLTGDEPHYLLVAHSLVFDHDLDLTNNYAQKDFVRFYVGEELGGQGPLTDEPPRYPPRAIGLPVLLSPFYAIGGRQAATLAINAIAAAAAAVTFLVARQCIGRTTIALVVTLAFALTPPWLNYAFLIYSEIAGALATVVAAWALLTKNLSSRRMLIAGLAIAVLPWLNVRFIAHAFALIAVFGLVTLGKRQPRQVSPHIFAFAFPLLVSAIGFVVYQNSLYGSASPLASYEQAGYEVAELSQLTPRIVDGLFGWLFDQRQGLFLHAPLTVFALPGLVLAWRERHKALLLVSLPLAAGLLSVAYAGFWQQWSVPPRYLVSVLPLIAILAGFAISRAGAWVRFVSALLLGVGIAIGLFTFQNPLVSYRSSVLWEWARALPPVMTAKLPMPSFSPEIWLGPGDVRALCQVRTFALPAWYPAEWRQQYEAIGDELDHSLPEVELHQPYVIRNETVLPPGPYTAVWHAQLEGGVGPALELQVIGSDGHPIANEVMNAPTQTTTRTIVFTFHLDRYAEIGQLEFVAVPLGATPVAIEPAVCGRRSLPYNHWPAGLVGMLGLGLFSAFAIKQRRSLYPAASDLELPPKSLRLLLAALAVLAGIVVISGHPTPERSYSATSLFVGAGAPYWYNGVGSLATDPASTSETVLFAPQRARGVLASGPDEFFSAGKYVARVRLRRGQASPGVGALGSIKVVATSTRTLIVHPLVESELPADGHYHDVNVPFALDEQRAITVVVETTGIAEMALERVSIVPASEEAG